MVTTTSKRTGQYRILVQFTLRPEEHEQLKALSEKRDIPQSFICREALFRLLEETGGDR